MKKTIALFDFDGTITSKDTLFDIARFSHSSTSYLFKLLLMIPVFVLMKSSLISKQRGKEFFLKRYFGNMEIVTFNAICEEYTTSRLHQIIRPKANHKIVDFLKRNIPVYIVSASPENWILPWAKAQNIEVIATQLEISNNRLSGKISGVNCNGIEKVNRIKKAIDLSNYDEIIVFGDTSGDLPMLDLATIKNYKPFT